MRLIIALSVAIHFAACTALPMVERAPVQIYAPSPAFQVNPPLSTMPTPSLALLHNSLVRSPAPTPQHEPQPQKSTRPDYVPQSESQSISSSVRSEVPPENLHIGEKQLEDLLSLALDAQFYLEVMSDKADAKGHQESLGTIPVHLRVKELTIGGVSVPSIHAESLNRVVGPINFGNVRI